jgi:nicotinate-nucleotide adenylyltransferase
MNIALFGGTFDPIHYGHLAVARAARRQFMLEEILFVPSGVPPHKRAGAVTPFHDRHAMVVLATAGERSFVPSRLEDPDLVAGATYSIDTVRRVRRALGPSDRLFFLIGADAFLDIATWRGANVLTREVEFVVASRPGFSLAVLPERVRDRATLHLVPGLSERISATEVRRAVHSGERLEDLVDPAVAAYIYRAGLYRANSCAHHRSRSLSCAAPSNGGDSAEARETAHR